VYHLFFKSFFADTSKQQAAFFNVIRREGIFDKKCYIALK